MSESLPVVRALARAFGIHNSTFFPIIWYHDA